MSHSVLLCESELTAIYQMRGLVPHPHRVPRLVWRMLARVNGARAAREIIRQVGITPERGLAVFRRLEQLGVVTPRPVVKPAETAAQSDTVQSDTFSELEESFFAAADALPEAVVTPESAGPPVKQIWSKVQRAASKVSLIPRGGRPIPHT